MSFRFEKSRPGHVWIGGKSFGEVCKKATEVPNLGLDDETLKTVHALCQLVHFLCETAKNVHRGRFDRRLHNCVTHSASVVHSRMSKLGMNP